MGNRNQRINPHGINVSILLIIFSFLTLIFLCIQNININMGKPTLHGLYPHMIPQANKFVIIEAHLISNVYTVRS